MFQAWGGNVGTGSNLWQIKSLGRVCKPIGGLFSSTVSTPLNLLGIMKKYLFQLNKYWIIKVRKNHFGENTNHHTWNQNKVRLLILYWWCWWHGSQTHQWTIMTLIIWRRSNPGQAQLSVDTSKWCSGWYILLHLLEGSLRARANKSCISCSSQTICHHIIQITFQTK